MRTVFAEADSLIYDLCLSYDAKKVLFSMRRHYAPAWQIFELNVDGTGLRQLTNTPEAHNASPAYLPSGGIAFVSSREPRRHTVCQPGPSTLVHVMDADGSHVRRLSSNTLSDFNLGVLSDGRLLYSRWSYVDWNLTYRQSLWTQYPDGRQLALWFGNQTVDPASLVQAMELPDYSGALCTFAPHHGSVYGAIGSVQTRKGPEGDGPDSVRNWTPEFPCIYDRSFFWAWCWPAPLAVNRALASRGDGATKRFKIMLLADDGRRATVYEDPQTSCFRALPLVARRPPKDIAPFVDPLPKTYTVKAAPPGQPEDETVGVGRIVVSDVYKGLDGKVPRGAVTHVRVMEQLPKTVNRTWNGVLDQGPLLSASTYYAKRLWTYAPVAADGSVHFEAPALKEIYLQLVDAEGREIRRMTDAINLMPGETQSCTGCHEGRRTAAVPLATSAARFLTFGKVVDRAWPGFDDPLDVLATSRDGTPRNIRAVYAHLASKGTAIERFRLGARDQIRPLDAAACPGFEVFNLCANGRFVRRDGSICDLYRNRVAKGAKQFNENGMSCGMIVSYGKFRYFTAGDFSDGLRGEDSPWAQTEDALAEAVGPVDVAKLSHHGHHSMYPELVKALRARVWTACVLDQQHCTDDTMSRLADTKLYGGERTFIPTYMPLRRPETAFGRAYLPLVAKAVVREPCHVVLDVPPGGETYTVTCLAASEEIPSIRAQYGFLSRGSS